MKYQTGLNNVEFVAFHGFYPEEKLTGGKFIVDIKVEMEVSDQASMKRLNEVVNYELLYAIVKKEMEHTRSLIETVAKAILDEIGARIRKVQHAEVKIVKVNRGGSFKSGSAVVVLSKKFE